MTFLHEDCGGLSRRVFMCGIYVLCTNICNSRRRANADILRLFENSKLHIRKVDR